MEEHIDRIMEEFGKECLEFLFSNLPDTASIRQASDIADWLHHKFYELHEIDHQKKRELRGESGQGQNPTGNGRYA